MADVLVGKVEADSTVVAIAAVGFVADGGTAADDFEPEGASTAAARGLPST